MAHRGYGFGPGRPPHKFKTETLIKCARALKIVHADSNMRETAHESFHRHRTGLLQMERTRDRLVHERSIWDHRLWRNGCGGWEHPGRRVVGEPAGRHLRVSRERQP